jgi:hypothetical protein
MVKPSQMPGKAGRDGGVNMGLHAYLCVFSVFTLGKHETGEDIVSPY